MRARSSSSAPTSSGSSICLLTGLDERGETRRVVHHYDLWKLGPFERELDFADNPPPGDLTYPIFCENIAGYAHLSYAHGGDILNHSWTGGPVELLFVDIAKSHLSWDHVAQQFFPALIPGRSLVILQDYLYEQTGPWHHVVMEKLADHFEIVADTHLNSVVFQCTSELPRKAGGGRLAADPNRGPRAADGPRHQPYGHTREAASARGPQEMLRAPHLDAGRAYHDLA